MGKGMGICTALLVGVFSPLTLPYFLRRCGGGAACNAGWRGSPFPVWRMLAVRVDWLPLLWLDHPFPSLSASGCRYSGATSPWRIS
ncbi:hypothetical protein, unlikely [Trypanosoma brucei brucei TREU927]|uniref:Uncharacterized protein n=1 Tax=Trypanosoma brucei brucei (strain 927/4 GUTat10.1) TaxID=185431 RepID=Q38FK6_TRYB2|nr:hypothetical protein, unlikely [Trypanosoma brucei brucei TREU927]EAN76414.1 hypothetical protein, unlikely [Trypanosoma brucei brucei TREU927]